MREVEELKAQVMEIQREKEQNQDEKEANNVK